jgi:hypothetical protein
MTSPDALAAGLRANAQGLYCLEAAAELLIATSWLHRPDFTSRFAAVHPGIGSGQLMTVIDWPAAVAALGSSLACSGGEQRMLKITASIADGIPVDLRDTLTGLDDDNIATLVTAILHAAGKRPGNSGY